MSPTYRNPNVAGSLLAARYRPLLAGRPAVISFVTVAELGYGARLAEPAHHWVVVAAAGLATTAPPR